MLHLQRTGFILLVVLLACMFFGTSSAVDPSGIWRWDDDVLTIEYVGGEVSGTFKNEDVAEVEITDAELDGAALSLKVSLEFGGQQVNLVFSGGISGNQISGTIKAGEFGEFPWNATRIISMPPADPGTAFSEDFNHQSTLSSRRSEFNVLGADEYSGGTIAVIERLMRSIKDECTRRILVPLREDAIRREITFYIDWYNQNRPHQSLGGRIPMDAYFGIDDEITRFETQGEDAVPIQLIVTRFESRRHLPIVELKRAA